MADRVAASDLDGTLLDGRQQVTPRTAAAVARWQDAGGVFVAVTARPLRDALGPARAAGADLLVCGGGGVLAEPRTGRVVSTAGFAPSVVAAVVAAVRAAVPDVRIGIDDGQRCVLDPGFVAPIDGDAGPATGRVLKVILQSPTLDADSLAERVRPVVGGALVTVSCPEFAEILPAGVHKGTHLTRLFPRGVGTVAFGDMPNDLPMLDWAATSVAVANAHPAVLARCDRVTASNDEDGVAAVLDQIVDGHTRTG